MTSEFVCAVEAALQTEVDRPIGHHDPEFNGTAISYLENSLKNSKGDPWVKSLTAKLSQYTGMLGVVCTNSGTSALHIALLALGIKPNEEVLVPSLTFVATANAVRYVNAYPHFIDCSGTITPYKLRRYLERNTVSTSDKRGRLNPKTNRVISAVIVVDLLGFPADWPNLELVADEFGVLLIEDASQALGSKVGDRQCGSFGHAAILSFNYNKLVTGFGGGALLTDDEWTAAKANQLATTARLPHPWTVEHDAVAYNYRMSNLNAALICSQFDDLKERLNLKFYLHTHYAANITHCKDWYVLHGLNYHIPNYWLNAAVLKYNGDDEIESVMKELHHKGIGARLLPKPLHQLSQFDDCPRELHFVSTESAFNTTICLPSGMKLAYEISRHHRQQG